jgi:hypothetical protein
VTGSEAIDHPAPKGLDPATPHPFKGNIDCARLERKETLLSIACQSALHYGTGGTRGSPPDRPTIEGSVSSRNVDEIRKSPNPGTPGDVKLSNCMSST